MIDLVASGYGNLPVWAEDDPAGLWKAAEKFERKNGAVYREATIALPNELTVEQNQALVADLVSKLALGKPYQFAIHAPKSSLEGEVIPHLHLMTSDRVDDGIERSADRSTQPCSEVRITHVRMCSSWIWIAARVGPPS